MKLQSAVSPQSVLMVSPSPVTLPMIQDFTHLLFLLSQDLHISTFHLLTYSTSYLMDPLVCLRYISTSTHQKPDLEFLPLNCFTASFALLMATQRLPLLTRISESSFHLYFSLIHTQSIRQSYWIDLKSTPSVCVPLATSTAISLVRAPPPLTWVSFGLAHLLLPSCPLS